MEVFILDEIFIERLKDLIKGQITKICPTGIRKLANFFGVSPAWLAGFSDEK